MVAGRSGSIEPTNRNGQNQRRQESDGNDGRVRCPPRSLPRWFSNLTPLPLQRSLPPRHSGRDRRSCCRRRRVGHVGLAGAGDRRWWIGGRWQIDEQSIGSAGVGGRLVMDRRIRLTILRQSGGGFAGRRFRSNVGCCSVHVCDIAASGCLDFRRLNQGGRRFAPGVGLCGSICLGGNSVAHRHRVRWCRFRSAGIAGTLG
jgi:hypothetical protein